MVTKAFSVEDGNQNSSLLTSRNKKYSDIDLLFANKISGDIFKKIDAAAVKQSVKNIVRTGRLEKPFQPEFGANLGNILFELADEGLEFEVEERLTESIRVYEPRAREVTTKVVAQPNQNSLSVTIEFKVGNMTEPELINTTIARLR